MALKLAGEQQRIKLMAQRLAQARRRAGLSQKRAAERVGVRSNTLSGWEAGTRTPRALDLLHLCEVYGCTADYLIGRAEQTTGFPSGELLIDQTTVDKILRAKDPEDLIDLVDWDPQMISFWSILKPETRVATRSQVQALSVELASHVRKVAPKLWQEFELAQRELKKRKTEWSRKPPLRARGE